MVERPLNDYVAELSERTDVRSGVPLPMGIHEAGGGVNFALFSRHATHVRLKLFDKAADAKPTRVIGLDPVRNRTGDVWHVWLEGIRPCQLYGYRVDGPCQPEAVHRFNVNKLLLDPFATAISLVPDWDFSPALAQADVGIAIGSDVAVETADVILVRSNPPGVVAIVQLSHATYSKMIRNLVWATGYNIVAIPLAAGTLYAWGVVLTPAVGAALMAASTVIVAINARLLKIKN